MMAVASSAHYVLAVRIFSQDHLFLKLAELFSHRESVFKKMTSSLDLAHLADDKRLVVAAYVCAFIPWGFLYASDFISPNWRTVRKTRLLAALHLLVSVPPMSVVIFYSVVQNMKGDYKEMMAAILALVFSLYHVARTIFGLIQVHSFMRWCIEARCCMTDIGMKNNVNQSSDLALMVNNTLVDNELSDTEIIVRPSILRKILELGWWNPLNWWTTKSPALCTLRWTGSFLCTYGIPWRSSMKSETLKDLFSCARQSLSTLLFVTFESNQGNDNIAPFSLALEFLTSRGISLIGVAYNTVIRNYVPDKTFKDRRHQFNSLVSTYKASNDLDNNRNNLILELVDSVSMAKHLGGKRLTEIRQSSEAFVFPTKKMRQKAWKFLLAQCGELHSRTSKSNQNPESVPEFPWKRLMSPLWDIDKNWRVLQATAQRDIQAALKIGCGLKKVELPSKTHVFDYYLEISKHVCAKSDNSAILTSMRPSAVVLEAIRSFFAENLKSTENHFTEESMRVWDPEVPTDSFSLSLSDQLLHNIEEELSDGIKARIVWECQLSLHRDIVSNQVTTHRNLPSSVQVIILFILGFPALTVDFAMGEIESKNSDIIVISPAVGPTRIVVELHLGKSYDRGSATLRLRGNSSECKFEWNDWINAAMGFLKGYDLWNPEDRLSNNCTRLEGYPNKPLLRPRTISKTNVQNMKMITISSPDHELPDLPCDLHIWTGWPIFDVRICQFEMKQWMYGAALDQELSNRSVSDVERFDEEVEKAEQALLIIATS